MSFDFDFDPEEVSGFTEELGNVTSEEDLNAVKEKYKGIFDKLKAAGKDFTFDEGGIKANGKPLSPEELRKAAGYSPENDFESDPRKFYEQLGFDEASLNCFYQQYVLVAYPRRLHSCPSP